MLVTQSQSQIAKSKLLPGKGNPVMRDIISPSSPQWVHMGLRLHPLPLLSHEGFQSLQKIVKVPAKMVRKIGLQRKTFGPGEVLEWLKKIFSKSNLSSKKFFPLQDFVPMRFFSRISETKKFYVGNPKSITNCYVKTTAGQRKSYHAEYHLAFQSRVGAHGAWPTPTAFIGS